MVDMFQGQCAAKEIKFVLDLANDFTMVFCDGPRIVQVLSNLIGNAIKFTPKLGTITVSVKQTDQGIQFCVSDTGKGITSENLPHIFERYWQAEDSRKMGAGLGLSIARGIVEAHGGKIWAEGQRIGSKFFFVLPKSNTLEHSSPDSSVIHF